MNSSRRAIAITLMGGACAIGGASFQAAAQWSHNPAANSGLVTGGSNQNQAKTLPTADGGWYVAWLDGQSTGWDTRLQRYNSRGIPQWIGNGVLVADTAFSSTQDYGFAIDANDNALIAYRDDGNVGGSPVQIKLQKVDPNGNLLWGTGAQVSVAAGGSAPHCCATSDGGAVAGWSTSAGNAAVQKVDATGAVQWVAGGVLDVQAAGLYFLCDVVSDNAGGAIALYHHQTGGFSSPRHVKAQRFDFATGAKLWNGGSPVVIFDGGSLALGYFPYLIGDGNGGVYTAWYNNSGTRNAHVQHISSAGAELFPHDGATVADDVVNRMRVWAATSVDSTTGDIYLIAKEGNINPQGSYSLRVQKFDSTGARQWGSLGMEVLPPGAVAITFAWPQALSSGNGVIFTWDEGPSNGAKVYATRVMPDGTFAWTQNVIEVCSVLSNKARLWVSPNAAGDRALITWADDRTDAMNDVYGQTVNLNGTLGTPGDVNDDGIVNVADLLGVINTWGVCPAYCASDLNNDGVVSVIDLLLTINNWG